MTKNVKYSGELPKHKISIVAWVAKKEAQHFKPLSHPDFVGYPNSPLPLERAKINDLYKLSKFIRSMAGAVVALLYLPPVNYDSDKDDKGKEGEADGEEDK